MVCALPGRLGVFEHGYEFGRSEYDPLPEGVLDDLQ